MELLKKVINLWIIAHLKAIICLHLNSVNNLKKNEIVHLKAWCSVAMFSTSWRLRTSSPSNILRRDAPDIEGKTILKQTNHSTKTHLGTGKTNFNHQSWKKNSNRNFSIFIKLATWNKIVKLTRIMSHIYHCIRAPHSTHNNNTYRCLNVTVWSRMLHPNLLGWKTHDCKAMYTV